MSPTEIIEKLQKVPAYVVGDLVGHVSFTMKDRPDDTPFILVSLETRDAIVLALSANRRTN